MLHWKSKHAELQPGERSSSRKKLFHRRLFVESWETSRSYPSKSKPCPAKLFVEPDRLNAYQQLARYFLKKHFISFIFLKKEIERKLLLNDFLRREVSLTLWFNGPWFCVQSTKKSTNQRIFKDWLWWNGTTRAFLFSEKLSIKCRPIIKQSKVLRASISSFCSLMSELRLIQAK